MYDILSIDKTDDVAKLMRVVSDPDAALQLRPVREEEANPVTVGESKSASLFMRPDDIEHMWRHCRGISKLCSVITRFILDPDSCPWLMVTLSLNRNDSSPLDTMLIVDILVPEPLTDMFAVVSDFAVTWRMSSIANNGMQPKVLMIEDVLSHNKVRRQQQHQQKKQQLEDDGRCAKATPRDALKETPHSPTQRHEPCVTTADQDCPDQLCFPFISICQSARLETIVVNLGVYKRKNFDRVYEAVRVVAPELTPLDLARRGRPQSGVKHLIYRYNLKLVDILPRSSGDLLRSDDLLATHRDQCPMAVPEHQWGMLRLRTTERHCRLNEEYGLSGLIVAVIQQMCAMTIDTALEMIHITGIDSRLSTRQCKRIIRNGANVSPRQEHAHGQLLERAGNDDGSHGSLLSDTSVGMDAKTLGFDRLVMRPPSYAIHILSICHPPGSDTLYVRRDSSD